MYSWLYNVLGSQKRCFCSIKLATPRTPISYSHVMLHNLWLVCKQTLFSTHIPSLRLVWRVCISKPLAISKRCVLSRFPAYNQLWASGMTYWLVAGLWLTVSSYQVTRLRHLIVRRWVRHTERTSACADGVVT